MDDQISRKAALDAIDGIKPMQGNMEQLVIKALCWAAVKTIPAVDAVPIIRCASCKWWDKDQTTDGVKGFCPNTGCCEKPDFYCADGERRERE